MQRCILILFSFTILSCSPTRKYQNLPEVRSWEKDILEFEQVDRSVIYPDDAILFTGSSSIRLWSTIEKDMSPYNVIQRGYGDAKLSDFAIYTDRIISPHKCKAIVLFIANDIEGTAADKTPTEVAVLRNVLKTIHRSHSTVPVFWIAVTPTPLRWKVWPEIKKANTLTRNICDKEKNTYFIKTDFAFLNENSVPQNDMFRADKLHLSEKGYEVWECSNQKRVE